MPHERIQRVGVDIDRGRRRDSARPACVRGGFYEHLYNEQPLTGLSDQACFDIQATIATSFAAVDLTSHHRLAWSSVLRAIIQYARAAPAR